MPIFVLVKQKVMLQEEEYQIDSLGTFLTMVGLNPRTYKISTLCRILTLGLILALAIWEIILICAIGVDFLGLKATLSLLATPVLEMLMLYSLLLQRKRIVSVKDKMKKHPEKTSHKIIVNIILIVLFFLTIIFPGIISFVYVRSTVNNENTDRFYTMTYRINELGYFGYILFATFSIYLHSFNKYTFPFLMTLIYSAFCVRCRAKILLVKKELKFQISQNGDGGKMLNTLKEYQQILKIALQVDSIFSVFTLFQFSFHLMSLFTGLAVLLLTPLALMKTFEVSFTIVVNLMCLMANIIFASEIPESIRQINSKLSEISENMLFMPNTKQIRAFIKALLQREVVIFSTCGILYFTRSLILATLGSLLTYGIVIIQIN